MGLLTNLMGRLSNVFTQDPSSRLGQLFGAIAAQLDLVDPAQTGLTDQFSITRASGPALDAHGADWGVPRRTGEADDDYRARILTVVSSHAQGSTLQGISNIVANFTGVAPEIYEYGPDSFYMGVTPMGNFIFNDESPLTFRVKVSNPNHVPYVKSDLEDAINQAKPVRSFAMIDHDGGI